MTPEELFKEITTRFQTNNPYEIVEKAGIDVVFENWYPTTYGEFSTIKRTITINQKSPIRQELILAHELGHFFVFEKGLMLSRAAEEVFVEEFCHYFNH